jgi:hypothetical protein
MLSRAGAITVAVLFCGLSSGVAGPVGAQDLPVRTLSAADAEFNQPMSCVSGLRELSDGRIVVANLRDTTLQIIDLRAGTALKVGRVGRAPGELRAPATLYAGPGDATLLWDRGNERFLSILTDGTIGRSFAVNFAPSAEGAPATLPGPRGGDRQGRIYFATSRLTRIGAGGRVAPVKSIAVIRFDPATSTFDTVASYANPIARSTTPARGTRAQNASAVQSLLPEPTWTVTSDGRIAFVHVDPYHVEYLSPSGARTVGPTIRYTRIPVTEADRAAPASRNPCFRPIMLTMAPGSAPWPARVDSSRADATPPNNRAVRDDGPEYKPPFPSGAAVAAPDGTLWVQRTRAAADDIPSYDVFDAQGQLVDRVALPRSSRLLGFGNGTIYLSRPDGNEEFYIQRYRLHAPR